MTLRVVFRRAAQREFEEAAVWYEERRAEVGTQVSPAQELIRFHERRSDLCRRWFAQCD